MSISSFAAAQSDEEELSGSQYDGIVDASYATYLKLDGTTGAELTPGDLPELDVEYDFTLAMWLKPSDASFKTERQHLFSLEGSLGCFLDSGKLSCGDLTTSKGQSVDVSRVRAGQWTRLTFASKAGEGSYLQLSSNAGGVLV